jgi:hypothetical protein
MEVLGVALAACSRLRLSPRRLGLWVVRSNLDRAKGGSLKIEVLGEVVHYTYVHSMH